MCVDNSHDPRLADGDPWCGLLAMRRAIKNGEGRPSINNNEVKKTIWVPKAGRWSVAVVGKGGFGWIGGLCAVSVAVGKVSTGTTSSRFCLRSRKGPESRELALELRGRRPLGGSWELGPPPPGTDPQIHFTSCWRWTARHTTSTRTLHRIDDNLY